MHTLGDNPCLPEIIGSYFNYRYDNYGVWIGDKYVSIPYFSYGNAAARQAIKSFSKWEYRGLEAISENYSQDKVISYIKLISDEIQQYESFNSGVKRKINKAIKNSIAIRNGGDELLNDFYSVYFKNMHKLGSPALEIGFFSELIKKYKNGEAKLFVAYKDDKAIGSAFLLSYAGFFENTWFATLRNSNYLYPSYLLHWEMIKYSIEKAADIYSFGRSTIESSVYNYKKQWNTNDLKLYWSYSKGKSLNIRKIVFLNKLWKIMPVFFVKIAGKYLAKKIY